MEVVMNLRTINTYIVTLLLVLSPLSAKTDYEVLNQPAALEKALVLSNTGVLKQKENGFVYLDISNQFITAVIPLLDHEGTINARPTAARSIGAHISVFDEGEKITPKELGNSFSFSVKEIRNFTLHTRDGLKKLWVIAVESPELEQLREKYGVSPKLKGYDYHITLGKQMPKAPDGWEKISTLSELNFSNEPTEGLSTKGDFVVVPNSKILKIAAKIDQVARLTLKSNGYVYLDVNDQFVDQIAPHLPLQGSFEPVATGSKKTGAHISVFHEDETIGKEIWNFKEIGQWFTFTVKELRYIDRKTANGPQRLWVLAVDAPGLERLRKQYGLKPKMQGHDFHITLGNEALENTMQVDDPMQVDDAMQAQNAA